jgi:hypothetical protein
LLFIKVSFIIPLLFLIVALIRQGQGGGLLLIK